MCIKQPPSNRIPKRTEESSRWPRRIRDVHDASDGLNEIIHRHKIDFLWWASLVPIRLRLLQYIDQPSRSIVWTVRKGVSFIWALHFLIRIPIFDVNPSRNRRSAFSSESAVRGGQRIEFFPHQLFSASLFQSDKLFQSLISFLFPPKAIHLFNYAPIRFKKA